FRGLGHVDSRQDTLSVKFELVAPLQPDNSLSLTSGPVTTPPAKKVKGKRRKSRDNAQAQLKTIEVELVQDKTALRTRKGDTGSVLWRASNEFAQVVLQQHNFKMENSIFDHALLAESHVVELGSGTGLLSVVLSPLVRRHTATDIPDLLPLIRKNVKLNFSGWPKTTGVGSNIFVEELDWQTLQTLPLSSRHRYCPWIAENPADLVLVVDCIYHPSLLPSLVETIDYLSEPGRTWVMIVVELRQEDVVREFLDLWIKRDDWLLWRVNGLLDLHFAVWVGHKKGPRNEVSSRP
ncbi:hypothetical protein SERLADRAFT_351804, partial [Serpula lacrymans var. lacrymans S7.9]